MGGQRAWWLRLLPPRRARRTARASLRVPASLRLALQRKIAERAPALHCLLLELCGSSRAEQRSVGCACALGLASSLTGAPLAGLAWARACPLSKPQVVPATSSAGATPAPLLPINISHEGRLLAVAFSPPPCAGSACLRLGVDVQCLQRAARALAAPHADALLRSPGGAAGALPTPRALAGAPADSALLFSLRWTLMEAVLKARGGGLAEEGAGAAVLSAAMELAEGGEEAAPALHLWGARAADGAPWSDAAVATATAAAAAAASAGESLPVGLQRVPFSLLAHFQGPAWRAITCTMAWPGGEDALTLSVAWLQQ